MSLIMEKNNNYSDNNLQPQIVKDERVRIIEEKIYESDGKIALCKGALENAKFAKDRVNNKAKDIDKSLENLQTLLEQKQRDNRKLFVAIYNNKKAYKGENKSAESAILKKEANTKTINHKLAAATKLQQVIQGMKSEKQDLEDRIKVRQQQFDIPHEQRSLDRKTLESQIQRLTVDIRQKEYELDDLLSGIMDSREYKLLDDNLSSETSTLSDRTELFKQLEHLKFDEKWPNDSSNKCSCVGILKLLSYLLLNFGSFPAMIEAMRRDFEETGDSSEPDEEFQLSWVGVFYIIALSLQFLMVVGFLAMYSSLNYCKCDQNNRCFSSGRFDKFKAIWNRYKGPVQCLLASIIIIQYLGGLGKVGWNNKGYWAQILCNIFLVLANWESFWNLATKRISICCARGNRALRMDNDGNHIDPSRSSILGFNSSMSGYRRNNLRVRNDTGSDLLHHRVVRSVSQHNYMDPVLSQRHVVGSFSQQRKPKEELIFFY